MPDDAELMPEGGVLQVRSYRLFWLARVFSALAYQMSAVAVGWQMYSLTHSTFSVGMVGLAQFAPMLLLVLVVGHVIDRFSRRHVLAVSRYIEALMAAGLLVGSLTHHMRPWVIFCSVAVLGVGRAFENPAGQAVLPSLLPMELLPRAISLGTSAMQTASIIGPGLGGLLYVAGPELPYAICTVSFATAGTLSLFLLPWRSAPAAPSAARPASSIFSGIHFIRSRPKILGAISLDLFAVLLGGATALLPAFTRDILHIGPWGLGLLRLCPAVGALAVSVTLGRRPIERNAGRHMFTAVVAFGLATVGFAVSRSLPLSMFMLMVIGAADVVSVVVRSTLVQLETPDEMRGRVSAVNSLFIGSSNQLGEFESGVTASWFGLVPATVIGGLGSVLVALLWMRFFPDLRRLDRLHDAKK